MLWVAHLPTRNPAQKSTSSLHPSPGRAGFGLLFEEVDRGRRAPEHQLTLVIEIACSRHRGNAVHRAARYRTRPSGNPIPVAGVPHDPRAALAGARDAASDGAPTCLVRSLRTSMSAITFPG